MIKGLAAIRDAMAPHDPEDGADGQDREEAERLADAYVAKHPEEFVRFDGMSIAEIVCAIDVYRAAGVEHDQWLAEAWHLHMFAPQNIGGTADPQLRIHGN